MAIGNPLVYRLKVAANRGPVESHKKVGSWFWVEQVYWSGFCGFQC